MANRASPVETTYTTTEADIVQLGYEFEEDLGDDRGMKTWIWIQMTGGAAAAGEVIERAAGSLTAVGVAGAATTTRSSALGVAQHAIAQNSYGYIQKRGIGQVLADGNVTADADIVPDASAEVTDFTAGAEHRVIGTALATDTGASTLVNAILDIS